MGLVDILLQAGGGSLLDHVAKTANTDKSGAEDLLRNLGSAMFGQVKGRVQSQNHNSSKLEDLIKESKYANMLDSPSEHYHHPEMRQNGNILLDYITGNKQGSREIASQVAKKTGFDVSIIKNLLPMLAPFIIGSLGKGMMGGSSSLAPSSNNSGGGLLSSLLDFDHDGSVIDDVAGLAMKYIF